MNDLYPENYMLMKDIKKKRKTVDVKISHTHGLEELILLKYPYYQKQLIESM